MTNVPFSPTESKIVELLIGPEYLGKEFTTRDLLMSLDGEFSVSRKQTINSCLQRITYKLAINDAIYSLLENKDGTSRIKTRQMIKNTP